MTECPECGKECESERGMRIHYGHAHDGPAPWEEPKDFDCPSCDRSFETERGMQIHHAEVHGESLTKVTVECDWCGEEVKKPRHRFERDDHHYCSRECSSQWRTENLLGEDNPHWKGGMADVECAWCDKALKVYQANDRYYDVHFCSVGCEGKWKSENQSGENSPAWKGATVEVECDYCGDLFSRYQSHVDRNRYCFCDPDCRANWLDENAGYDVDYGPEWSEIRERAIKFYGSRCQRCGKTEEEHISVHGCSLHVHHVERVDKFDDPNDAHDMDNLMPLCASCHGVVEPRSGGFPLGS